jgi:thioredoxin 1
MKNISSKEFEVLKSGKAIFQFSADWCGPCKTLTPILEVVSQQTGVDVFKVDIGQNSELAQKLLVRSIPAVFFYSNGNKIYEFVGNKPKNMILNEVQKKYGIL